MKHRLGPEDGARAAAHKTKFVRLFGRDSVDVRRRLIVTPGVMRSWVAAESQR